MSYAARTALLMFVPGSAFAAGNGEGSFSFAASLAQMLGSLAVVLGLIYLASYLSRRWSAGGVGRPGRQNHIRVVETRHLAPKKSLLLVAVGGEYLLLGNGSEGITLIKQIDMLEEHEEIEAHGAEPQRKLAFQEKLEGFLVRLQPPRIMNLMPGKGGK